MGRSQGWWGSRRGSGRRRAFQARLPTDFGKTAGRHALPLERLPDNTQRKERVGGMVSSLARATRGLGRPSLDARSRRKPCRTRGEGNLTKLYKIERPQAASKPVAFNASPRSKGYATRERPQTLNALPCPQPRTSNLERLGTFPPSRLSRSLALSLSKGPARPVFRARPRRQDSALRTQHSGLRTQNSALRLAAIAPPVGIR